jgi:hypothetical protein
MKYELIRNELSRTNRNFMITIIVLIAILAGAAIIQANEIYNLFSGPFPMDNVSIQSMGKKDFSDKANPFTFLSDDEYKIMSQTDIDNIKSNDYSTETAVLSSKAFKFDDSKYFGLLKSKAIQKLEGFTKYVDFSYMAYALVPYGDGYVIVKATNADIEKGEFRGVFAPMTDSLLMEIKSVIKPEYKDKIYSDVFYSMGSFETAARFNLFTIIFFLIIIIYMILRLVRRIINPKCHPIYKKISIYGDPDDVVKNINEEYLLKESKTYKNEIATPSFIIKRGFWRTLISLNDRM